LVDKQGKIVILSFALEELQPFAHGLAVVKVGDKYGYVDKQGTLIVEPRYDRAYPFDQGLARVVREEKDVLIDSTGFGQRVEKDYYGLLDDTGKVVVPLKYSQITYFHEDRARVFNEEGHYGIIDRSGRLLTPFMFLPHEGEDFNFHGGLAYVEWEEGNGYINREGKFIWKSE